MQLTTSEHLAFNQERWGVDAPSRDRRIARVADRLEERQRKMEFGRLLGACPGGPLAKGIKAGELRRSHFSCGDHCCVYLLEYHAMLWKRCVPCLDHLSVHCCVEL